MARDKPERLLNLTFMLLSTSRFIPKEQIRRAIGPYREAPSEEAFERMFERDKEELRGLGIDIETGSFDAFFGDDPGYRIRRDTAELPEIELTPQEAAAVGVAANVWQHPGLAGDSSRAVVKLKAAGLTIDPAVLSVDEPRLRAEEPAFDAMLEAATTRRPVAFKYQREGYEVAERHLQPWGVLSWRDRWYVGGFDTDRGEPRLFRISRVQGAVKFTGEAGFIRRPCRREPARRRRRTLPADTRPDGSPAGRPRTGAWSPRRGCHHDAARRSAEGAATRSRCRLRLRRSSPPRSLPTAMP